MEDNNKNKIPENFFDSLAELKKHIAECYAMIDHFVGLSERYPDSADYREEIKYWRKMLQNAKIQKRRMFTT